MSKSEQLKKLHKTVRIAMKKYVIYSQSETDIQDEDMYWSNSDGWTHLHLADTFTEKEKEKWHLPMGGEWRELTNTNPLWDNDLIQFARLICEINANVEISKQEWQDLKDSMDLDDDDINELFDRANEVFESHKQGIFQKQY